jgi:3-dehydroquinate synthase
MDGGGGPTDRVRVELGARSYDILIGAGVIDRAGTLVGPLLRRDRVLVVTDETVARLWGGRFEAALAAADIAAETITVPAGEVTKSFAWLERLCAACLDRGLERGDLIVALGGGVVGDLAGFAAAILLRGVRFVQVPTTLLAQVDSGVGGKTAIDMPQGKNLVGAFHQPSLVIADTATLDTLPPRQLRAGYAEVVKYGLIRDRDLFAWLETGGPALLGGDAAARGRAIGESCRAKAAIVAADEREAGERALLNLGHTFGHAFEAAHGYGDRLLHGEAIAVGMVLAFALSVRLGLCPADDAARMRAHLAAAGLPVELSAIAGADWTADRLIALMQADKKVAGGRLTFVLARGIGDAVVMGEVDTAAVRDLLDDALRR